MSEIRPSFNKETGLFLGPKQEEQVCKMGPGKVAGDTLGSQPFLPGKVLHVLLVSPGIPCGGTSLSEGSFSETVIQMFALKSEMLPLLPSFQSPADRTARSAVQLLALEPVCW